MQALSYEVVLDSLSHRPLFVWQKQTYCYLSLLSPMIYIFQKYFTPSTAPHLRGMVLAGPTGQLSCHTDIHPGLWVGTPTIYPIYYLLEYMPGGGGEWPWRTIATESPCIEPRVAYLRGVFLKAQYCWCTRRQRPWTWSTAHYTMNIWKQSYLVKRVYGMTHSSLQRHWDKGRGKGKVEKMEKKRILFAFCCFDVFCICFFSILFYFLLFLFKFSLGAEQGKRADTERLGDR